jgi:hypothetical protein
MIRPHPEDRFLIDSAARFSSPYPHCPGIPQTEFAEIMVQVKRWGLDQYLKEHDIDSLIHTPAA